MNTLIQTPIERPQKALLAKPTRPSICALTSIALTFACFALSLTAEAANDNTKLGKDALQANTTATDDTALGYQVLKNNTTGSGDAQIQKVSAQSEMTKPASRLVVNKP